MITAQMLYDLRERDGEIDGNDLHDLFRAVCGEPSPAGRVVIEPVRLVDYAKTCVEGFRSHKAGGGVGGQYFMDVASFCLRYRAAEEIADSEQNYDLVGNAVWNYRLARTERTKH